MAKKQKLNPDPSAYIPQINAAITTLGGIDTVQVVDLSSFPYYT